MCLRSGAHEDLAEREALRTTDGEFDHVGNVLGLDVHSATWGDHVSDEEYGACAGYRLSLRLGDRRSLS